MGAPQRALLCALLLLLLLSRANASAAAKGELCRVWNYGQESPAAAFRCPQQRDRAADRFCCGTCGVPYCCTAEVASYDRQQRCPHGGTRTTLAPTKKPHHEWAPGFAFLLLIPPVCLFVWMAVRYYKERRWPRLFRNLFMTGGHRSFPSLSMMGSVADDLPPPDVEVTEGRRDMPQPLLPVRPQCANAGDWEYEVVHRNVLGLASGAASETASSSSGDQ